MYEPLSDIPNLISNLEYIYQITSKNVAEAITFDAASSSSASKLAAHAEILASLNAMVEAACKVSDAAQHYVDTV